MNRPPRNSGDELSGRSVEPVHDRATQARAFDTLTVDSRNVFGIAFSEKLEQASSIIVKRTTHAEFSPSELLEEIRFDCEDIAPRGDPKDPNRTGEFS
jgi:hypothetical protein